MMNIFNLRPIMKLPLSSKFIIYILRNHSQITPTEIVETGLISRRTVGVGLKKLIDSDLVKIRVGKDKRKRYYHLNEEHKSIKELLSIELEFEGRGSKFK